MENLREHDEESSKIFVQMAMEKENSPLPAGSTELIEEALTKMIEDQQSLGDVLGFSDDMLEVIYRQAFALYQSGKMKDALAQFEFLRQLNGTDPRFTFAIAAAHHKLKNYDEAAANYLLYETLDETNPIPYYHLSDCFLKLDHPYLALDALTLAHTLASQNEEYSELIGKIELELEHVKSMEQSSVIKK